MEPQPRTEQSCSDCVFGEFKPENVAPVHENSRLFIDSQWTTGRLSVGYVIYRVVVAMLLLTWLVADILVESSRFYSYNPAIWLVLATNWSLLVVVLSSAIMAVTALYYFVGVSLRRFQYAKPIGIELRFQWIVYNIAANSAFVVSVVYWSFIFLIVNEKMSEYFLTPMSQLKHTLNSIYVIIDLFINAMPIRLYHVIYPFTVGLVYVIFNVIYISYGGDGPDGTPFVYAMLDWRYPITAIGTTLLGFVVTVVAQLVLYGLYHLRLLAHRRLNELMLQVPSRRRSPMSSNDFLEDGEDGDGVESTTADERGPVLFSRNSDVDSNGRSNVGYKSMDSLELERR